MAAPSKFLVNETCYEFVHTWTTSCRKASKDLTKEACKYSFRMYSLFFLVSYLVKVKGNVRKLRWRKYARDVVQSTLFLGTNCYLFLSSFCALRHFMGGFNIWFAFLCGLPACLGAISIERKSRRGVLALYVSNLAAEVLFNIAVNRGYISPIKYGEVLIFSLTASIALYLLRVGGVIEGDALSTLRSLFGSSEIHEASPPSTGDSGSVFQKMYQFLPREFKHLLTMLSERLNELPRHQLCRHDGSCIHYISEGFFSRFSLGYAIQTALNLFRSLPNIARRPSRVAWSFVDRENFYLGVFMGGLVGIFRVIMCLLRWIRNKDSPVHAAIAGFLAGFSSLAYRSSTVALYFTSKVVENLFSYGQKKGYCPTIPGGDRILYTLSTSTLIHAAVFEPHTIRPAYWKFLLRLTGNYFAHLNRKLVDVLGTNASKLYPDFWPKYDMRYASSHLQTEEMYHWWMDNVFLKT